MKNNKNWLKLNRSILTSSVFDNPKLLKVWIWCLCKASHKEREQVVGRQIEHLHEGQFIFGRKVASRELNMAESTVYRYILQLKQLGNVSIKTNNKYSVITVENWRLYQYDTRQLEQLNEQQMNNKRTTKRLYWANISNCPVETKAYKHYILIKKYYVNFQKIS